MSRQYVLTLRCPDNRGIIHAITGGLVDTFSNIVEQSQYTDEETRTFFLRTRFDAFIDEEILIASLQRIAVKLKAEMTMRQVANKRRILIMVSKQDHCLVDLLYRHERGELPVDIPVIVSNHEDTRIWAERYNVPFFYLPIDAENKSQQERKLLQLVSDYCIDAVILARYMQILSPHVCDELRGRIINIHHSFLPSFVGANPYEQAHQRGVKLIGATAHYVTADLDEGPIIEQEVQRVTHQHTPEALAELGRDIERNVLVRAVRLYAEDRVFLDGKRTIIFP